MPSNDTFKFYRYDPSTAAAALFLALFFCTTVLHFYQLVKTRTLYFIPFLIGGFFEWIGYAARIVSSEQTPNWTLTPYLVQTLLLLVAPALFAASIYMELGRIVLAVDGERYSIIKRKWLTKMFVAGDIFSFTLQAAGGGLMSQSASWAIKMGPWVIVGGLAVQLLFFGFFVTVALVFNRRMNNAPAEKSIELSTFPWQKHLYALYAASILVLVRSTFRLIEFIQGNDGYILQHEIFLYIFDATLMFGVMVIFNIIHPSEVNSRIKNRFAMESTAFGKFGQLGTV